MHPGTQLETIAELAGFLLKSSLGFCICWGLTKIVVQPNRRYLVWFSYLLLSGSYWIWFLLGLLPHGLLTLPFTMPASIASGATIGKVEIQDYWALPISIFLRWFGYLYLAVIAAFLFKRTKKQAHLRWILRFTYRAPETIDKMFHAIAEGAGAGKVKLLMLSGIYSPATFGWLRPTVLLPPLCLEQDEAELRDIFRHELQHIQRRDFVWNGIASACRSLLFFHPAAWYAMRRLNLESELACDLAVVGDSPEKRASYAECLLRFARLRVAGEPTPWNLDFAGSSVQLKVRIRSMLVGSRKLPVWALGLRATLGLLLTAGFVEAAPSLRVILAYRQPPSLLPVSAGSSATSRDVRETNGEIMKARLRQRATTRASDVPAELRGATVTVDNSAEAASPPVTRVSRLVSGSDPVLKQRGAGGTESVRPVPGGRILLSDGPSSDAQNRIARRASAASAITAGASEALRVASHGRDKDDH